MQPPYSSPDDEHYGHDDSQQQQLSAFRSQLSQISRRSDVIQSLSQSIRRASQPQAFIDLWLSAFHSPSSRRRQQPQPLQPQQQQPQHSPDEAMLALIYVANDVIQLSARHPPLKLRFSCALGRGIAAARAQGAQIDREIGRCLAIMRSRRCLPVPVISALQQLLQLQPSDHTACQALLHRLDSEVQLALTSTQQQQLPPSQPLPPPSAGLSPEEQDQIRTEIVALTPMPRPSWAGDLDAAALAASRAHRGHHRHRHPSPNLPTPEAPTAAAATAAAAAGPAPPTTSFVSNPVGVITGPSLDTAPPAGSAGDTTAAGSLGASVVVGPSPVTTSCSSSAVVSSSATTSSVNGGAPRSRDGELLSLLRRLSAESLMRRQDIELKVQRRQQEGNRHPFLLLSRAVQSAEGFAAAQRVAVLLRREFHSRRLKAEIDNAMYYVLLDVIDFLAERLQRLTNLARLCEDEKKRRMHHNPQLHLR